VARVLRWDERIAEQQQEDQHAAAAAHSAQDGKGVGPVIRMSSCARRRADAQITLKR
jgi:hypothetical protein